MYFRDLTGIPMWFDLALYIETCFHVMKRSDFSMQKTGPAKVSYFLKYFFGL